MKRKNKRMTKVNDKVLVLDIDGTLTNSNKEISPKTKEAIINVMKRGHKVILASGRPTPGMRRYVQELELEKHGGYILSYNGARVIDCKSGDIIYQKAVPQYLVPSLFKFAKNNDLGLITFLGDEVISGTRVDDYIRYESKINQLKIREVENFVEFVDFEANKFLMTAPPERAEYLVVQLQEKYGQELSIYRSEPFFIEIMPQNIDKAKSLERMLLTIGLDKEDMICCGDGFNDLSMIEYAGIGVAMGNAQDKVKEVADYITASNDHDGIVEVIEEFIL